MPATTVRASLGATRIQQVSHQTLRLAFGLSAFNFILPPGIDRFSRLLLETQNSCSRVIRFVLAFVQRASQYELPSWRGLAFFRSFASIERKQDGYLALLAANAEVPSDVGSGPGHVHWNCSPPFRDVAVFAVAKRHGANGCSYQRLERVSQRGTRRQALRRRSLRSGPASWRL